MIAQFRSEALKLRTVRSTFGVAALAVALELTFKVLSVAILDGRQLGTTAEQIGALRASISLPVLSAALGVLTVSPEWQHRVATPTFLVQPRRPVVVAAKGAVAALTGLGVAAVAVALATGAALAVLDSRGAALPPTADVAAVAAGQVVGCALMALLGVGLGGLVASQSGSLAAATGVLFVLPPLAFLLSDRIYAYTPSGALDALSSLQAANPALLAPWAGATVLAGYAAALSTGAVLAVRGREIA